MPRANHRPISRETALFAQELIARLGEGSVSLGNPATGRNDPPPALPSSATAGWSGNMGIRGRRNSGG